MAAKLVTLGRSNTPLAAAGAGSAFLTGPLQVGQLNSLEPGDGFSLLKGALNGDQNCTIDIYQGWNLTDILAVTAAVPATGLNNGVLVHRSILFVGGAAVDGIVFTQTIGMPFVLVRVTNTSGILMTQFRFHVEAAE